MEGFDILKKWMAKHHPDLDLSGLVISDVEKELLSPPSEVTTMNVVTIAEVTEEAVTITLADPVPDEQ